jgi:hypothetical protein
MSSVDVTIQFDNVGGFKEGTAVAGYKVIMTHTDGSVVEGTGAVGSGLMRVDGLQSGAYSATAVAVDAAGSIIGVPAPLSPAEIDVPVPATPTISLTVPVGGTATLVE